jgi:hypothetical protein
MRRLAIGLAVVLGAGVVLATRPPVTIDVAAGSSLQGAIDNAPRGAVLHLGHGDHTGGVVIDKTITIEGDPGARVVARDDSIAITIRADRVLLQDLVVEGGTEGVSIRTADAVLLRRVAVQGAELHGIEVVDASARITSVTVEELSSPYAQGVEIRYADNHPKTIVEDSLIVGGQEGLVSHVSRIRFEDNVVAGTSQRAISITEMSHGVAARNRIEDALGSGLYCGDMSRCQFVNNSMERVSPGDRPFGPEAGWGLVVNYESSASSHGDELRGVAGERATFAGSVIRPRSPLELGAGLGAVPAIALTTLAALALLAVALVGAPLVRATFRRFERRENRKPIGRQLFLILVWIGVAIQTFHMGEHVVQVFRVRVDGVPSKGALVGSLVDTEWVHFTYNALVLIGLIVLIAWGRRVQPSAIKGPWAERFAGAALLVQGYHVVEHSVKIVQHIETGRKVNEGLLGGPVDLVLLHFAINATVYFGLIAACAFYLRGMRLDPSAIRTIEARSSS